MGPGVRQVGRGSPGGMAPGARVRGSGGSGSATDPPAAAWGPRRPHVAASSVPQCGLQAVSARRGSTDFLGRGPAGRVFSHENPFHTRCLMSSWQGPYQSFLPIKRSSKGEQPAPPACNCPSCSALIKRSAPGRVFQGCTGATTQPTASIEISLDFADQTN